MRRNTVTIQDINIRATADDRFWGRAYRDSIYLWESAKHNLTLREAGEGEIPILEDSFPSKESVREAHDFCRAIYYKYLGILSRKLNEIHELELPEIFWRTVLGTWLYRHISIVYDKFVCLQRVDLDRSSIVLLSQDSFYIPNDHYDYVRCFCNDHGVIQLISQYYHLFAQTQFEEAHSQCDRDHLYFGRGSSQASLMIDPDCRHAYEDRSSQGQEAQVAICCAFYTEHFINELYKESRGKICRFTVPPVAACEKPLDLNSRELLGQVHPENAFEEFLAYTMPCCTPKILVEYFRDYYDSYSRHVESSRHTDIVTECWTSFMPVSIYCAIARENKGVRLIFQQHGASLQWLDCDTLWLEMEVADRFITTGWQGYTENSIAGGFAIRERLQYQFGPWQSNILHVCTSRLPYLLSCGAIAPGGARFLRYLESVNALIDMMPPHLKSHYVLRPRREPYFWDTEHSWDVEQRGIRIEAGGDMLALMMKSRIVIIDHISTGLGEILFNRIPFILLYIEEFESLSDAYTGLFDDLIACGVVHRSYRSVIKHLETVYDDIEGWWKDVRVQQAVEGLVTAFLGPHSRVFDYLLSLVAPPVTSENKIMAKTPLHEFFRDSHGVYVSTTTHKKFVYSDGEEREDRILKTLQTTQDCSIHSEELRGKIVDWVSEYHFSQERHNLLRHLQLHRGMKILEMGCGCGAITRQLGESGARVTAVEGSKQRAHAAAARCRDLPNVHVYCSNFQDIEIEDKYDLVTLIGVLEYSPQFFESSNPIRECLEIACNSLKSDGVLAIAIENQLGLKYLCGFREDHVDIPFYGIEDRYSSQTAVTFGKRELTNILHGLGLTQVEFHYPFPDYKVPRAVLTEKAFRDEIFRPEEIIRQMQSRDYAGELTPTFDERLAVPVLCRNGLMEELSHAFLVLASRENVLLKRMRDPDLLASFYTTERAKAYNVRTDFVLRNGAVQALKRRLLPGRFAVSQQGVLAHCPIEEKYVAGLNLESEYRKCVYTREFQTLSQLLSLQLNFLLHEGVETLCADAPARSTIRPEFIGCIPANLIISDGRLHYIGREWILRRPVSLGALVLRTIDDLCAIDKSLPELSRGNLLMKLSQAGFHIESGIVSEYEELMHEIFAQVYEGSQLSEPVSTESSVSVRSAIEGILRKIKAMPNISGVLQRVAAHLEHLLCIRDGQNIRPDHLSSIALLGPATQDEIEMCRNVLNVTDRDPGWWMASKFLRQLLSDLENVTENGYRTKTRIDLGNPFKPLQPLRNNHGGRDHARA